MICWKLKLFCFYSLVTSFIICKKKSYATILVSMSSIWTMESYILFMNAFVAIMNALYNDQWRAEMMQESAGEDPSRIRLLFIIIIIIMYKRKESILIFRHVVLPSTELLKPTCRIFQTFENLSQQKHTDSYLFLNPSHLYLILSFTFSFSFYQISVIDQHST